MIDFSVTYNDGILYCKIENDTFYYLRKLEKLLIVENINSFDELTIDLSKIIYVESVVIGKLISIFYYIRKQGKKLNLYVHPTVHHIMLVSSLDLMLDIKVVE